MQLLKYCFNNSGNARLLFKIIENFAKTCLQLRNIIMDSYHINDNMDALWSKVSRGGGALISSESRINLRHGQLHFVRICPWKRKCLLDQFPMGVYKSNLRTYWIGAIQVLCNAVGEGGFSFPRKKRYEGVCLRFNVISVTRGGWGSNF